MTSTDPITWFRSSSPYINDYRGKTFVVYLPGEAIQHQNFSTLIQDLALLHSLGIRLVLVHGARAQIDARLAAAGTDCPFAQGQRITSSESLSLVLQAIGEARIQLESALSTGLPNSPMHGAQIRTATGNYISGMPKGIIDGIDFQFTGKVRKVDALSIRSALDAGAIALIANLGYSTTGEVFNIASQEVATAVAIALNADKFLSFVPKAGLVDNQGQLLRQISVSQCGELLKSDHDFDADATAALSACFHVCAQGVRRAQLVSYAANGALLEELFTRGGSGSLVYSDTYESVRHATIADVGGLLAIIEPLEQKGALVRRSRELLETEIDRFSVVEIDGMVVGCAGLYPYPDGSMAELAAVATHADYLGKGIAKRLLAHVESQAKSRGYGQLFVLTTQTAHWFLERGFVEGTLDDLPAQKQSLYNLQRRSKVLIKTL